MNFSLARRVAAETLGTAALLAAIVGSGIMASRLADGNIALALLANSLATGAALVAVISSLQPISGAHLNPAVTLSLAWLGRFPWRFVAAYCAAQVAGAIAGVISANVMFGEPPMFVSHHDRAGAGALFSEFIATFGLVGIISTCSYLRPARVSLAVGAYIAAAYWFTGSTSFANPAVTIARSLTDTFAGIAPNNIPSFVIAQLLGCAAAAVPCAWLIPRSRPSAPKEPAAGFVS
jgi:glycerol uptake facilitator-like aquaporin